MAWPNIKVCENENQTFKLNLQSWHFQLSKVSCKKHRRDSEPEPQKRKTLEWSLVRWHTKKIFFAESRSEKKAKFIVEKFSVQSWKNAKLSWHQLFWGWCVICTFAWIMQRNISEKLQVTKLQTDIHLIEINDPIEKQHCLNSLNYFIFSPIFFRKFLAHKIVKIDGIWMI